MISGGLFVWLICCLFGCMFGCSSCVWVSLVYDCCFVIGVLDWPVWLIDVDC